MENQRNILLDIVKLVLSIMVVFAHCDFGYDYNLLLGYVLKNGVFRLTVPVFFMINGFYFTHNINFKQFQKWFLRVLMLYVFWMFFYSFVWLRLSKHSVLENLIFGWHHLWYVVALVFSGLMLYSLKKKSAKTLTIISVILFLVGIVIEYLSKYPVFEPNNFFQKFLNKPYSSRNFLFFGFPFFTIGYVLRDRSFEIGKKNLAILLVISFFFLCGESLINFYTLDKLKGFDMLLSQLFVCPLIFVATKRYSIKSSKIDSKTLSLYSSAIYFIHTLPWIYINVWFNPSSRALLSFFVLLCSIILSFLLIKLNSKFKFIL